MRYRQVPCNYQQAKVGTKGLLLPAPAVITCWTRAFSHAASHSASPTFTAQVATLPPGQSPSGPSWQVPWGWTSSKDKRPSCTRPPPAPVSSSPSSLATAAAAAPAVSTGSNTYIYYEGIGNGWKDVSFKTRQGWLHMRSLHLHPHKLLVCQMRSNTLLSTAAHTKLDRTPALRASIKHTVSRCSLGEQRLSLGHLVGQEVRLLAAFSWACQPQICTLFVYTVLQVIRNHTASVQVSFPACTP